MEYQQINNGESGLSVRTKLNAMLQGIIEDTTGLPGKMVRISEFTTGNVPQITANGMLEDSGKKVSDFVLTENVVDSLIETYDNYPLSARQGNILNNTKVDKVTGKSLSDRNFTEEEKIKLANIAIEANKYILPEAGASLGGVKSGGDVTISAGLISVNDDSHNHIISNVDGLQTALGNRELLSNKVPSTSTLSGASTDSEYPSAKLMYNLLGSGGGLQTLTNLVTAFQGTPDNTHYPSEKLVADSLALKISTALKGIPNGVAELDADGFLVASQLPGSVPTPRILEGIGDSYPSVTLADEGKHFWHTVYKGFYIVDAAGAWVSSLGMFSWEDTLWVLRADNTYWRYVEPSFDLIQVSISPLVLGELSTTAYRGDRGKIAYDFSQNLIDNLTTDDATKPLSAKQGKLLQDNKMSKVSEAVAGRIPLLLSTGELEDSGKSFSDILSAEDIVNELGDSETQPISQKAVTDVIGIGIKNLALNGDLSNGLTGWTVGSSTHSVIDGKLVDQGRGTSFIASPYLTMQSNKVIGHKYYARANVTAKTALCLKLSLHSSLSGSYPNVFNEINNPTVDVTYLISGISTAVSTSKNLTIEHLYATNADQSNGIIEIDNAMCIDLTEAFGEGSEPTKEFMDELLSLTGYFDYDTVSRNIVMKWMLEKIKRTDMKTGIGITNIVPNGDMRYGLDYWGGWATINSLGVDGKIINTGIDYSSASEISLAAQLRLPTVIGHKYYARANVTSKSPVCQRIRLYMDYGVTFASVDNPILNNQYLLSGVLIANRATASLAVNHLYVDRYAKIGQSIEVSEVMCIDLTEAFGEGNEPTKEYMDAFYDHFGYWDGDNISRKDILFWQDEKLNSKAESGGSAKTLKQVDDSLAQLTENVTTKFTPVFNTIVDLTSEVETIIPYSSFTPSLNLRPANIQVYHNDELKNMAVKYMSNGENFDIKITSTENLSGCEIVVIGTSLDAVTPEVGDILVWNATTNKKQFVNVTEYDLLPVGSTALGVVFHRENGENLILSKDDVAMEVPWTAPFKTKMVGFDFATGGSFTITVNTTTTDTITYLTSDTLTTLAVKIQTAMNAGSEIYASPLRQWYVIADTVNNCIALERWYYVPVLNSFYVTDASSKVSGSIICIDKQSGASGLTTPHPSLVRNDGGISTEAALNWERFYSYLYTGGYDLYDQTPSDLMIINYARFNTTDNPLLVAFWGDGEAGYERYLWGKMVKYPFPANMDSFKEGKNNTDLLSTVMYTDIDGTQKPLHPAAYAAKSFGISINGHTTGLEAGNWWLPSVYEMYFMINSRKTNGTDAVNLALTKIGGTKLNNANIAYWTCNEAQAQDTTVLFDYGSSGRYSGVSKYVSKNGTIPMHVRAITKIRIN